MSLILDTLEKVIVSFVNILNDASVWLIFSFILAGLLHHLLNPEKFQRMLGNRRLSSIVKAALSGMLLPICSCGVIPLGLGMYYSGAYLGPTLAFMTATPIINPAALLLAYGFLGPQIATIYLITGFILPLFIGIIANVLAGSEIQAPGVSEFSANVLIESSDNDNWLKKLSSGLHWGFMDLGVMVSKYIILGIMLAGLILSLVPQSFILEYLGNPGMISLIGIALVGSVMYVCAVGHIPFIAALVASGAAPGIALTFLVAGAATNLPELISIYKTIGRRAVCIYSLTMITFSMLAGYVTNRLLLPEFTPLFDLDKTSHIVGLSNKLILTTPDTVNYLCSAVILVLGFYSILPHVKKCLVKVGISQNEY